MRSIIFCVVFLLCVSSSARPDEFPLQWKVTTFNANGNFVVDGKPFFPLGLYSCMGIDEASGNYFICAYNGPTTREANIARFKTIKDAGFNLLQTYTMNLYGQKVSGPGWGASERGNFPEEEGETTHELYREGITKFMDYAQEVGLKVMIGAYSSYSLPHKSLPLLGREKEWEKRKKVLEENIKVLKNHPALLVWYLFDEPSGVNKPVEDMTECYRYIKSLDSAHPMLFPSCDPADSKYLKATDIIAPDPYPIETGLPINEIAHRLDAIKKYQEGSPAMPQVWGVIQICQWVEGRRLPSIAEMRLMSLLALTRDVKGLLFYEHANYPEKNPQQWQNISQVVKSLQSVIPYVLASGEIVTGYKISNDKVHSITRKVKDEKSGRTYYVIIAVNPTQNIVYEPIALGRVTLTFDNFKIEKGSVVTVLDEDEKGNFALGKKRELKLFQDGDSLGFVDNFGEYASHIYKIGLPEK